MKCHRCDGDGTVTGADRDCPVCKGEGEIPTPIIGHIDSVTETPAGIVASGGWCAPSETIYDMASKDTTYVAPEPDPLPQITDQWTDEHSWIVIDEYGDRAEHYSHGDALRHFVAEQARTMNYDTVVMREQITRTRTVAATHGNVVPKPPTPEEMSRISGVLSMLPGIPVRRGGITFQRNERETP